MIGVFVFPDFQLLDAAGPISVFEIASRLAGAPAAIRVLAEVPGGGVIAAARSTKLLAFVRAAEKRGVRIASVCSGAYILAEAGLLDGRRATTHWRRTPHFLSTYPRVKLESDKIFVRDGGIWSSAGISA